MAGSISKFLKGLLPGKKRAGFAFKIRAEIPVVEIYGETQQAGVDAIIAVRGDDLAKAQRAAVKKALSLAPGSRAEIIAMKDAYESDFTDGARLVVLEQRAFGQSKHGRF